MGSACRTFARLNAPSNCFTQVAGRAGRGNLPGIVLVQTINPDHYAVRLAAAQDYQAFYEKEFHFRESCITRPFPPWPMCWLAGLKKGGDIALSTELSFLFDPPPEKLRIMGPAEHRYRA